MRCSAPFLHCCFHLPPRHACHALSTTSPRTPSCRTCYHLRSCTPRDHAVGLSFTLPLCTTAFPHASCCLCLAASRTLHIPLRHTCRSFASRHHLLRCAHLSLALSTSCRSPLDGSRRGRGVCLPACAHCQHATLTRRLSIYLPLLPLVLCLYTLPYRYLLAYHTATSPPLHAYLLAAAGGRFAATVTYYRWGFPPHSPALAPPHRTWGADAGDIARGTGAAWRAVATNGVISYLAPFCATGLRNFRRTTSRWRGVDHGAGRTWTASGANKDRRWTWEHLLPATSLPLTSSHRLPARHRLTRARLAPSLPAASFSLTSHTSLLTHYCSAPAHSLFLALHLPTASLTLSVPIFFFTYYPATLLPMHLARLLLLRTAPACCTASFHTFISVALSISAFSHAPPARTLDLTHSTTALPHSGGGTFCTTATTSLSFLPMLVIYLTAARCSSVALMDVGGPWTSLSLKPVVTQRFE